MNKQSNLGVKFTQGMKSFLFDIRSFFDYNHKKLTMKKLNLLILFLGLGLTSLVAQEAKKADCSSEKKSCAKTCAKVKAASVDSDGTAVLSMAESIAEQDENIEKRVCSKSGSISYYEKNTCEKSGKVTYNQVEFDQESSSFVNVSPRPEIKKVEGEIQKTSEIHNPRGMVEKADMLKKLSDESNKKKACCAKGSEEGKACCSKKTDTE